jgi:hypothetical protein
MGATSACRFPPRAGLLAAVAGAARRAGQFAWRDFDLDFPAIRHDGDEVALEQRDVPHRSQSTESVLSFFGQDGDARTVVYADATLGKAEQAAKVLDFARHIERALGERPALLVFDSRLTTGEGLDALDRAEDRLLTLRQRNPRSRAGWGAPRPRLDERPRLGRHERRVEVNEQRMQVRACGRRCASWRCAASATPSRRCCPATTASGRPAS